MTTTAPDSPTTTDPMISNSARSAAQGWYLYGISRSGPLLSTVVGEWNETESVSTTGGTALLHLLETSGLAAVVGAVLVEDFSAPALRERLRSASEVEAMVRSHHRVIEAIHARQAILPAKFGTVYAHASDIQSALQSASDKLVPQLNRLEGCDEWAVHLYASREAVREHIAARTSAIMRLRDECAAASPGRGYFLERQLRDELEAATDDALTTIAQSVFDRLRGAALVSQVNATAAVEDAAADLEILRAAFLVPRDGAEQFLAHVRSAADAGEGLRCEYSGAWPPYSFAASDGEEAE